MSADLSTRKKEVLYAVVHDFIATAEPVGSSQVAARQGIRLSSATIRTVMAELEELGFLSRSHLSAGRVPTGQGYRFFVDRLLRIKAPAPAEKDEIRRRVEAGLSDVSEAVRDACRIVSDKVNQASLAIAPSGDTRHLKHIQFVGLKRKLALAVLVSTNGIVENKLLELNQDTTQAQLDRMSNYLNERMAGLTIRQVRQKILREMKQTQNQYDEVLTQALALGEQALGGTSRDVHIEGQSRIFSSPDLGQVEKMQQILKTLEEKTLILRLLDQSLVSPGVKILIGEETEFAEINGLTLITSAYSDHEGNQGLLGVIGPTRMNYARIVPLVDFTSKTMTDLFHENRE